MGLPLVTKEEYKAYAGIVNPGQDTIIEALIPRVSALVKSICRRSFVDYVDDNKVDIHEGGCNEIVTEESPIISVVSMEVSTDYGKTYTLLTEYEDYAFSRASDSIKYTVIPFESLVNGYRITYTAGYEELPEDLKLAIFDLITYYLKNDMAVHSNKAPGTNTVQIEYVTTTSLPAHIKRVLDLYTANFA